MSEQLLPTTLVEIKDIYPTIIKNYERIGHEITRAMEAFLISSNIPTLPIQMRTKAIDSFEDKIRRKSYSNPFAQVTDLCGIRIICVYPKDIHRICEIIVDKFKAKSLEDTSKRLGHEKVGYRSYHFNVKLKKNCVPVQLKEYADYSVEIQIRTISMHAWAEVSHKLAYKADDSASPEFKRKINLLSALFELADNNFEQLVAERDQYLKRLRENYSLNHPVSLESLTVFLESNFLERSDAPDRDVKKLLDELLSFHIKFPDLDALFKQYEGFILKVEAESKLGNPLNKVGMIRVLLDLVNDEFWKYHKEHLVIYQDGYNRVNIIEKWRKEIQK